MKRERYTIAALVMRPEGPKSFKHGIALFPGHPGIMKLQEENGQPQYEQRGNFLVRRAAIGSTTKRCWP